MILSDQSLLYIYTPVSNRIIANFIYFVYTIHFDKISKILFKNPLLPKKYVSDKHKL